MSSGDTLREKLEESMAKQIISESQEFNVAREEVFATIADPYKLAAVNSLNLERIKDSTGDDINGVGSVRRLKMGIFRSIDEVITVFEVPELIEYRVLTGVPVKNHVGRIEFVDIGKGRSRVDYSIQFDPIFPGFGRILRIGLQKALVATNTKLASQLE